jgi:hypothetical protein
MNRSVRNGLAIAGMAGGMLFLGQAVAQADGADGEAVITSVTSDDGGDGSTSRNTNDVSVENEQQNSAENGDINADTGDNNGSITTGGNSGDVETDSSSRKGGGSDTEGAIVVNSGGNTIEQHNTGATITDSNIAVVTPAPSGGASGSAVIDSTTTSTDDDNDGRDNRRHGDRNDSEGSDSRNTNNLDVENEEENSAENGDINANTGDNDADIVTGGNSGDLTCIAYGSGSNYCTIVVNSGGNTIEQHNTGATITGSNHAVVGDYNWGHPHADHHNPGAHDADCPDHKAAAAPEKKASPVAHRAAMNTTAQPKGELAYTGAETSTPLTLGLLALGAGGALTLAGRRRTATAAV